MSSQLDVTNPNELLNQRFRDHFSKQDSTLYNLLNALEKPLLQFLKSLLAYTERANTSVESAGKGTLNALPRIFTGNPQVDSAHMVLSTRARQFLDKCLDRPSYFIELDQLQRPLVENVNSLLQQMDLALEQHAQVTFKLRFAQLAWYRSYRDFAMARGWTLCASFDRFGALLPRLVAEGFEEFVQRIKPDANQTTRDWMLRLTLAGFRYDYLTRDEQTNTNNYSDSNDGYLFILPLSIGHHLWEHDLKDVELQQARSYLHRLGLKCITLSFPSSLHNLARSVTLHYMAAIRSSGRPPVPQCIARPAAEVADTITANPLPSNLFSQAPRSSWPANQPRLTNMDATSATGSHQQPPSQEHTREEAKMYAQASSYIAGFDQRRDLMTTKRPHSPAPVPAPASSVGYQQVGGRLAIEPPPNSPRVMANHMGIRSIPGPDQQAGVSHNQQPQAWQKAVTHYLPTTQQQAQLGPSAFANGPTTSVVSPSQPCPWAAGQLPEGQRPSEAIVSEKQDTSGSLTNAEPLAATTKSQAQGQRFPPGLYLNPRNPLNTYSLSKTQKPTGRRLTKLERSKLSQQQQQSISYEAAHGPTVSERQQPNSAEVAETSSPSLNNMEQQRPGTFLRTSGAQIAPVIPAQRIAQMMPRTHGLPMPQTPPQSLASSQQQKIQADSAAYINQCYGISPTQGQDQEQSPSPDPADQVNPYSTPKPTVQTPAQQNSASDTTLEPIDKPIAQMKKEEHTAFASPLSETDESEVVEKSISGITKHRLPAGGSPEEPIHVIDGDSNGDGDDGSEYEEGGRGTKKRKKLRRHMSRRRAKGGVADTRF